MLTSGLWSKKSEEWLESLPGRKRRWDITIFRNELADGCVKQVVLKHFTNARSYSLGGEISFSPGELHFFDEAGKEVVISSMPFIARETTPDPSEGSTK